MTRRGFVDRAVRSRGWILLAFLALVLVVVNGSQSVMLTRAMRSLEEELERSLLTVGGAAITAATAGLLLDDEVHSDDFVRGELERVRRENDVSDLVLLDRDGVVLLDLDGGPLGAEYPFLALDRDAFERARSGHASVSELFEAEGAMVKAAYVPVFDRLGDDVDAVLCVTAGGDFHERLPTLTNTALFVSVGSAVLVALLTLLFFRVLRRFAAADAALTRAETLSAMGMMAAGVAHEIRNPLAIISGTAERLRRKYGGDRSAPDELFDFIPEEVERLNRTLEGYLRFARDEGMTVARCDLSRLVGRCVDMVRGDFTLRGVAIEHPGIDEPVEIRADALRIQQVLLNLLLNAEQAMPKGGTITVAVTDDGKRAAVRISDDGPGFTPRALRGAFQPFFTTKEQGSGLGLSVARRIVEAHGGTIAVSNLENGGAVVTVELPHGAGDGASLPREGAS